MADLLQKLWPFIVLGAIVLVLRILFSAAGSRKKRSKQYSYSSREEFLTEAERRFLSGLEATIRPGLRVFAQVRIADLLKPDSSDFAALNKITSKHVDFVIVDNRFRIVCCVELDDSSHDRKDRKTRDEFVDRAFESAQIALYRFRLDWSTDSIREKIPNICD